MKAKCRTCYYFEDGLCFVNPPAVVYNGSYIDSASPVTMPDSIACRFYRLEE